MKCAYAPPDTASCDVCPFAKLLTQTCEIYKKYQITLDKLKEAQGYECNDEEEENKEESRKFLEEDPDNLKDVLSDGTWEKE
jgi:hypothetical protein